MTEITQMIQNMLKKMCYLLFRIICLLKLINFQMRSHCSVFKAIHAFINKEANTILGPAPGHVLRDSQWLVSISQLKALENMPRMCQE